MRSPWCWGEGREVGGGGSAAAKEKGKVREERSKDKNTCL